MEATFPVTHTEKLYSCSSSSRGFQCAKRSDLIFSRPFQEKSLAWQEENGGGGSGERPCLAGLSTGGLGAGGIFTVTEYPPFGLVSMPNILVQKI